MVNLVNEVLWKSGEINVKDVTKHLEIDKLYFVINDVELFEKYNKWIIFPYA